MIGASLAIKIFKEPVSELRELLFRDDLQLILSGNSSVKDYFKKAQNSSYLYELWETKLQNSPQNLIASDEDGMKEIASG